MTLLCTEPGPLLDALDGATRAALDTEFHGERRYHPRLHLVQVHVDGAGVFLLDPHVDGLLAAVGPALVKIEWIVHAGRLDLPLLERHLGGVATRVWDTQIAAGLCTPVYPASLRHLLDHHLGHRHDKAETLSDWSKRPLSEAQLRYAAQDVEPLFELWDTLVAAVQDLGRTAILAAACDEARAEALAGPDPEQAWTRIPGRDSLSGVQAAVLQELASWREREARTGDQPPGAILSNGVLLDLAKRQPLTEASLVANRRAPRSALRRHQAPLLEGIARASARPAWAHPPTIPRYSTVSARLAWWRAYVESLAVGSQLGARLVMPEVLLRRLALGVPEPWADDWRRDLVGTGVDAAMRHDQDLPLPTLS